MLFDFIGFVFKFFVCNFVYNILFKRDIKIFKKDIQKEFLSIRNEIDDLYFLYLDINND